MTLDPSMAAVIRHLQTGHPDMAGLIRQAIAEAPQPDTYRIKLSNAIIDHGRALRAAGRLDEALAVFALAILANPNSALAHNNVGITLCAQNRFEPAVAAFTKAIELEPNHADAHSNLGAALCDLGKPDQAIAACRKAIVLNPNSALAHNNLGNALKNLGDLDQAAAAFAQAISLRPNFPEAHNNLGTVLNEKGRFDQAVAAFAEAIRHRAHYPEAYNNLGAVLKDQGQLDQAIAAFTQALALRSDLPQTYNNLGAALKDKGQLDQAIDAFYKALTLNPNLAETYNNLGNALKDKGQYDQAIAHYSKAIELQPDLPSAHHNRAHMRLLLGDFAQGWTEYEWRWKVKDFYAPRPFNQPQWAGEAIDARTILLHADQGLGDTLQFIRYVPLVAQRGAKVIVECPPQLLRLLQRMPHIHSLHAYGQPLPPFDFHCPLLSLPLAFASDLLTIPANVPYLTALNHPSAQSSSRQIGLVWAGNPRHKNDRNRSMPLSALVPLAQYPVQFHSLQVGPASAQIADCPELNIIDHSPPLNDFADTADLIEHFDIVITVDTSVAHLAGAMGKPVWLLLSFVPDWRWLLNRDDSPWYPTMRLFRQSAIGDWPGVVARVAEALKERYP